MSRIGVDIVELDRLLDTKEGFINHVLSKEEIDVYNTLSDIRKKEYLGGRFASKEAIIKCLNGIEIPNMNEISVLNHEDGSPFVVYKDYDISISISHEKHYAIAMAMLNS